MFGDVKLVRVMEFVCLGFSKYNFFVLYVDLKLAWVERDVSIIGDW